MKKKLIILLPILFLISVFSYAQDATIVKGNKLYNSYSFSKSIEKYEQISDKTVEIKRHLADSYFRIGDYEKSESYYAEIVNSDDKTPEDVYNYAYVLSINEKYDDASKWMEVFNTMNPTDTRGILVVENKDFFKDLQRHRGTFVTKNLIMNTSSDDFGTTYYKNQVVFCSTRTLVKPVKRKWNWNGLPFLDIYSASVDSSTGELIEVDIFRKNLNKKYHEGPATFNQAGDYMVFTRNNYKKRSSDGISKLQLFYSIYNGRRWSRPVPMPFNDREYSVGHASLTPSGDTMYFASDMPGGIGGVDIYKSIKVGDTWGNPINLGKKVNTEGDEMFPFIHPNGHLFFSSNGWLGLGGLDVFVVKIDENSIGKVNNLGVPISSNLDDFAFIIDNQMEGGFFSSNRDNGEGEDDIYKFTLLKPFFIDKLIQGVTMNPEGVILSDVEVNLYDDRGNVLETIVTTATGDYEFIVEPYIVYELHGEKIDYSDGDTIADTRTDDYIIIADLILETIPEFSLYCIITDKHTGEALDSVFITMTNNFSNENESIITPESGDFARNLDDNKLNDSISYTLKLVKDGYLTKDYTYQRVLDREGQYNMHDEMSFQIEKITDLVDLNPIYFDLNKDNIRKDAAVELDKIVGVMNDYPDMVIELSAHTDSRGSSSYNLNLSDRRAKSSAYYVKKNITKPNRITGKGYGETQFLIVDQEIHDKYDFLPVGQVLDNAFIYSLSIAQQKIAHQLNRRTEFKIIKN